MPPPSGPPSIATATHHQRGRPPGILNVPAGKEKKKKKCQSASHRCCRDANEMIIWSDWVTLSSIPERTSA
eukprot:5935866-Pyramimonas_sp.AAC.1